MSDFIRIFPNVADKEYCDKIIDQFNDLQETQAIVTRQENERDDASLRIALWEEQIIDAFTARSIVNRFGEMIRNCYTSYAEKYGILSTLNRHRLSPILKIQKTKPSQGYHQWHCEAGDIHACRKIIAAQL